MAQVCNCSFSLPDTRRLDRGDRISSSPQRVDQRKYRDSSHPPLVERRQMWGALRSAVDLTFLSTASSTRQRLLLEEMMLARKFAICRPPRMSGPSEMGNDDQNLLHVSRRHLCPDRASAVDPDCDGVVGHLERH